ncbi:hypothetical protein ACP70R_038005 [Stipagrostis hirtigluma subsp. patula]
MELELAQEQEQTRRASWPDAPQEVLGLVVGRLPTLADRFRFGAVCRPWHAAERQLPRPRQLPWLALSLPSSPAAVRAAFYSLSDKATYQLPFPAGGGVCACFCGSADDWLVVAHRERGNFLLNPFTGATLPLPHQRTITRSAAFGRHHRLVEYHPPRSQREPYIRKAVLSCPPSVDDPGRCVVAATTDSGELFFCRPGQSSWRRPRTACFEGINNDYQDIAFCNGRLYGMIKSTIGGDKMGLFDVDEDADQLVQSRTEGGSLLKHPEHEAEEEGANHYYYRHPPPSLERRYCVESRGRLLMVERRCWRYSHGARRTCQFKVFHREPVLLEGLTTPREAWVALESLDGEVLFLGCGGSRSFAASELNGFDADCIYFTDDHYQSKDRNLSYIDSDNEWYDDPAEKQPCHDIGRYCMRDKSVTFLKDLAPNERRSPPTWLYLSDQRR